MARVVIKIDTKNFDTHRSGEWAKQMWRVLNELAFDAGSGDWEYGREGNRIDVWDPDGCDIIGSVTIVPDEGEFD